MVLAISSAFREKTSIALLEKDKVKKELSWKSEIGQSQKLLPRINQFLKKNQVKLEKLKAIAAYLGPGSYTSLRVGISIANALGWVLEIPVIGIKMQNAKCKSQNDNLKFKIKEISALGIAKRAEEILKKKKQRRFQKIIIPYYNTRFHQIDML